MKRILIIGCPGSGKSTLAKKLYARLNIDVYHLDSIWWKGNWKNVSKAEFDEKLMEIIGKDKWIIDGNYQRTLKLRLKHSDAVIYLDYNMIFCLFNVIKRFFLNIGKVREDMGENCVEKIDFEFISFILTFNRKNRRKIYDSLEGFKGEVYIFKSRGRLNRWLKNI